MICYLEGVLISVGSDYCELMVHGVGYQVTMAAGVTHQYNVGQALCLYIHTVWREQAGPQLFGFISLAQRQLFQEMLAVNGIGPKTALAISAQLSAEELLRAVQNSQLSVLTRIPGLGKKSGERLLLELANKLDRLMLLARSIEGVATPSMLSAVEQDACLALQSLGFQAAAAEKAVRAASGGAELALSELIAAALQQV